MSHSVTKVADEAFELVNAKLPPVKNIRLRGDYAWRGFFVFRIGCLTMHNYTDKDGQRCCQSSYSLISVLSRK